MNRRTKRDEANAVTSKGKRGQASNTVNYTNKPAY